jgi:hypothetical protein
MKESKDLLADRPVLILCHFPDFPVQIVIYAFYL